MIDMPLISIQIIFQTLSLIAFLNIFFFIHLIFKKKIQTKQFLVMLGITSFILFKKTTDILWFEHVDPHWHLLTANIQSGFPAFFVFREIIDFIFFNLSFYFLPLIFGATTLYVFLYWLNQKKVSLIALAFLVLMFHQDFTNFFSFSREPIILLFSLLFFYFLEKHYYENSRKHLIAATLFLCLACLTKLTGFLLIPFFLWVLMQKRRSNLFLLPVAGIILFMLFKTNLAANLHAGDVILNENLLLAYLTTFFIVFKAWLFVFCPWFIKPKNFLWQLNAYALIIILLVGFKTYFLSNELMAQTLQRYMVIFILPLILWGSIQLRLIYYTIKGKRGVFQPPEGKDGLDKTTETQ